MEDKIKGIAKEVDQIEEKGVELVNEVKNLKRQKTNGDDVTKDKASLTKGCLYNNEELMRRLEALDGLSVGANVAARKARKQLVDRIHHIMRIFDEIKDKHLACL